MVYLVLSLQLKLVYQLYQLPYQADSHLVILHYNFTFDFVDGLRHLVDNVINKILLQFPPHLLIQLVHNGSQLLDFGIFYEELKIAFEILDLPELVELFRQFMINIYNLSTRFNLRRLLSRDCLVLQFVYGELLHLILYERHDHGEIILYSLDNQVALVVRELDLDLVALEGLEVYQLLLQPLHLHKLIHVLPLHLALVLLLLQLLLHTLERPVQGVANYAF